MKHYAPFFLYIYSFKYCPHYNGFPSTKTKILLIYLSLVFFSFSRWSILPHPYIHSSFLPVPSACHSRSTRVHLFYGIPFTFQNHVYLSIYLFTLPRHCGPGSSVGIATDYGLDGPGSKSRWGRDFPPVQTGPGSHSTSCKMGTGSFPGVKCDPGAFCWPLTPF